MYTFIVGEEVVHKFFDSFTSIDEVQQSSPLGTKVLNESGTAKLREAINKAEKLLAD